MTSLFPNSDDPKVRKYRKANTGLANQSSQDKKRTKEGKMERVRVSSSNLASVGYDIGGAVLEVEFNHGGIYQYSGVPEEIYQGLMSAGSHGTYFDQFVKKAGYPYEKVG